MLLTRGTLRRVRTPQEHLAAGFVPPLGIGLHPGVEAAPGVSYQVNAFPSGCAVGADGRITASHLALDALLPSRT